MKISIFLCVFFVLISNGLFANMAEPPRPYPGNLVGQHPLKNISVVSEKLTINIPNTQRKNVKIHALYNINVSEPIKDLELIFIATNLSKNKFLVEIDSQPINGVVKHFDSIPNSWFPPDSIAFKTQTIPYIYSNEGLISFTIDSVTAGDHILSVSYEAKASNWFEHDDLAITSSLVYILQPTQGWKSFDSLSLQVTIPSNWDYTSNLELKRDENGTLHGFWAKLPSHHFAISLKPSEKKVKLFSQLFILGSSLLSFLLLLKWMAMVISFRIRKNKSKFLPFMNNFVVSFIGTAVFFVIYFKEIELRDYLLDGQVNPIYERTGYIILAFPFLWVFGAILTFIVSYFLTLWISRRLKAENYNYTH